MIEIERDVVRFERAAAEDRIGGATRLHGRRAAACCAADAGRRWGGSGGRAEGGGHQSRWPLAGLAGREHAGAQ